MAEGGNEIVRKLSYREMGLTDNEYEQITQIMEREPNYLELGMFSVM